MESYLTKSPDELTNIFVANLLQTNRGFNYYVDWENICGYQQYDIEIHALDVLIGVKDDEAFKSQYLKLVTKLPQTILLFPFLFGLSKKERNDLAKGKDQLTIIQDAIDEEDNLTYSFPHSIQALTNDQAQFYYDFFVRMGLKHLYQNVIEKSTQDYIAGVLVGMDSNGRKNRGGIAFELACTPIFEQATQRLGLRLFTQTQFKALREYGFNILDDYANRKADFIVADLENHKAINFEVNFYNGGGSKPEEIINSYIQRQEALKQNNIEFSLVTDGKDCWAKDNEASNQLHVGFHNLKYLQNFYMLKHGMLDEILDNVFRQNRK
ncbi:MAG: type II restriction endonuclease [Paludibacteraceae bacterium]|nr:type II restriction endonuclease [Paludibacteraceae bacterium]